MSETVQNRRIVISGLGMVTPIGIGRTAFAERLFQGDSGISSIEAFDTSHLVSHLGAEVRNFNSLDFISAKNIRRMDRLSQLAVASARLAMEDARFVVGPENRDRVGIVLGTAYGPTDLKIRCTRILFEKGPSKINPSLAPNSVLNAPAGHASLELGFRGVNTTVNHQSASGESALVYAAMELQRGTADVILAGGAEILSDFFFESLVRFRAVSPTDCKTEGARPFDINRNGPVAGEGCGIVCLELLGHALERGAVPLCEITGWGISGAPSSPTSWPKDGGGVGMAMKKALKMACLSPVDIGTIQAAGNGGKNPDMIEAEAMMALFGSNPAGPVISSVKGAMGESFSSGGIRAATLALSLQQGKAPPTLGLLAPIVPLPFTTDQPTALNTGHGMLNAVSHGGTNVSIVMSRIEQVGGNGC